MRCVYYDGTCETMGHVVAACTRDDARVFVVCDRNLKVDARRLLHRFEDCCGTIGTRRRTRTGSPRKCWTSVDGIESLLAYLSSLSDDDADALDVLSVLDKCHGGGACAGCTACARVHEMADKYGVYDT